MRSRILGFTLLRLSLCLAALNCFFLATAVVQALSPEIKLPADPDFVGANESFDALAWAPKALMPTPRIDFAIAAATVGTSQSIFAVGGRAFTITGPIDTLEAYDPLADSWSTKDSMPTARFNAGAATIADATPNERIYVVGGLLSDLSTTDIVEAYDPSADSWTTGLASMPTPRSAMGVTLFRDGMPLRGRLFAIGGVDDSGTAVATVAVYDSSADSWSSRTSMNTARRNPVVGVAGTPSKIYVIGGADNDGDPVTAVEEFTPGPSGGSWATKTDIPIAQLGAAGAVIAGKIYVAGGIEGAVTQTALSLVQVYDPGTDTWDTAAPMPTARLNHRAAVVSGVLYAIGGRFFGVARVGEPFLYKIVANNHPIFYDATNLPSGLSIDNDLGLIFGTPDDPPSESDVTLTVSNADGMDSQDVNLTVLPSIPSALLPAASEPAIKSSNSVTGRINEDFSFRVLVGSATEGTELSAGGTLPVGLTLNSTTGVISGKTDPLDDLDGDGWVTYHVVLTLKDSVLATSSETGLQLDFTSDPNVPVIDGTDVVTVVPGQLFNYAISTDVTVPTDFHYLGIDGLIDGSLPPGLNFNSSLGTISGTYLGASPSTIEFECTSTSSADRTAAVAQHFRSPDTIKIRPPALFTIAFSATNTKIRTRDTATRPLNFFEPIAVSRRTHGTGGPVLDINLPLVGNPDNAVGIECRAGTGLRHDGYQVVFSFASAVTLGTPPASVTPGTGGTAALDGDPVISPDGTVTVNLKTVSDVQTLTVKLLNVNDGTNTYPEVGTQMGVLIGDVDQNRRVDGNKNSGDLGTVRAHNGEPLNCLNFFDDVNTNGSIEASTLSSPDISLVKSKRGHQLP